MMDIETGTDHLLASLEDGVLTLTLNRPHRRNALSGPMLGALEEQLDHADKSPEIRCVVLTGAGGGFCSGGDVKGMAASNERPRSRPDAGPEARSDAEPGQDGPRASLDEQIHLQRLSQRRTAGRLYAMPKPTLAVLPGPAAGAGLSLALACDLRLAAEHVILVTAFAQVGLSGDYGGTFFMSRLIGAGRARELYYLSERVSASRALELGLVNWVVPADAVAERGREIARRLATGPSAAFRYMKENLSRASSGASLDDCLDLEATHHVHSQATADHREAARAFVEKRTPKFQGR